MSGTGSAARSPSTSAAGVRPPLWVWPSIGLGLLYPALARSARLDVELLQRLPRPWPALQRIAAAYQLVLVGLAVAVAVVFSLLRIGITDVYTESYPFMLLALAIGMASPAAGLVLVLLHILFDIVASAGSSTQLEPLVPALAGRAISWWLLWLLVVAIPLMSRGIPGATLASGQPSDPRLRRVLGYAGTALVAAVLTWMWTAALPYLIRPVFTWADRFAPTAAAIQPIQEFGLVLVAASVLFILPVTAVRERFGALEDEAHDLQEPDDLDEVEDEPIVSDQLDFVWRIVSHVLVVLVLGGLITGAIDVALLFVAVVFGQFAASRLARWGPLGRALTRVPWLFRFLVGFAATYVVSLLISNFTFEPQFGSEFFPLVLTVAIGLAIFRVLLGAETPEQAAPTADGAAAPPAEHGAASARVAGAVVAALLAGSLFLLGNPNVASADNCSGWGDCYATVESIAAAGAGAAAIVAAGAALAVARSQEPGRRTRIRRRRPRRPGGGGSVAAPTEPADAQRAGGQPFAPLPDGAPVAGGVTVGSIFDRLRRRALSNYGAARAPLVPAQVEYKLGDQDALAGKVEYKLGDQDALAGKVELKLGDQDAMAGKVEYKLGDQDALAHKDQPEYKLPDQGDTEGKL